MFNLLIVINSALWFVIGYFTGVKYKEMLNAIHELQHRDDSDEPVILRPNPNKVSIQPTTGSMVLTPKTPQQIEKEAEAEVDKRFLES